MSKSIEIHAQFSDAAQVVEQMKERTRRWAQKAPEADYPKVQERAREIVMIETALTAAIERYQPIIISETSAEAYRRGLNAGKSIAKEHNHGIIDRRVVSFDNFGSPYNAANEAKRKVHNARQTAKWADHF